ncbi:MAG: alpha/beta fold hydrolase [Myxococcales bacterium]|nr:alpha/beta fold hydrolase [Myxococcales bacterium]
MTWVFLHGFLGRPASWDGIVRRLGPSTHAIRPSLFGHGAVPPTSPEIAFDDEVDRIANLVEREGARGAHVVGYSMGARVALGLVVRHPHLVERATLIGVHPGLDAEDERAERRREDEAQAKDVIARGMDAFVTSWEALPMPESQRATLHPDVQDAQRAVRASHLEGGVAAALRSLGLGAMPSRWAALPTVRVPVDLVVGELDAKFRALAERAAEALPVSRVTVVPAVGHNVVLEAPDALRDVLVSPAPEARP